MFICHRIHKLMVMKCGFYGLNTSIRKLFGVDLFLSWTDWKMALWFTWKLPFLFVIARKHQLSINTIWWKWKKKNSFVLHTFLQQTWGENIRIASGIIPVSELTKILMWILLEWTRILDKLFISLRFF